MSRILSETFFKVFLVICIIPAAIIIGKAFLLALPILMWVLAYMAYKKSNNSESIMWVILAIIALLIAFVI